jgi:hypothetical protein
MCARGNLIISSQKVIITTYPPLQPNKRIWLPFLPLILTTKHVKMAIPSDVVGDIPTNACCPGTKRLLGAKLYSVWKNIKQIEHEYHMTAPAAATFRSMDKHCTNVLKYFTLRGMSVFIIDS